MTDIVEWLRWCRCPACQDEQPLNHRKAADEIERLRTYVERDAKLANELAAEIERLRTGVDKIIGMCLSDVVFVKIYATAANLLARTPPYD